MTREPKIIVFAEGQAGAPFVLFLCLGMAAATGLGTLLPWPPDAASAVLFAVVCAICAAIALGVGRNRDVRIDGAAGSLVERSGLGSFRRQRAWALSDFTRLEVAHRAIKVARHSQSSQRRGVSEYDTHHRFVLTLRGAARSLRLAAYDDVREAEAMAAEAAGIGGWPARRTGYTVEVSQTGSDAASRTTTKVHTRPGAESEIQARVR